MLAQSCYKKHYDAVAWVIHLELAKQGGFGIVEKWWDHHSVFVMQNNYETFMGFYNSNRKTLVT